MIVQPYAQRPTAARVALLTEGAGFLLEGGRIVPSDALPAGFQPWAGLERVNTLLKAGVGSALCWRGQPIRYSPAGSESEAGHTVRVLGVPFPDDDDDAVYGLERWRGWLASEGAAPQGSLGSTSMSLLRASLRRTLWTGVPASSVPPIRFTIGGRQELGPAGAPAEYTGRLRHYDLRAAYAVTLGRLEYGGRWYTLDAGAARLAERLDAAGRMVFVHARVRLDGDVLGPLVRRPRSEPRAVLGYFPEYPRAGAVQGVWTYPEVRAASDNGADVRIDGGWFHANGDPDPYPFLPWWRRVEAGRSLGGFAGLLAKATGNALWGQFCISSGGRKQLLYYHKGRRHIVDVRIAGTRKPAHDLSEYLTGKVRAELYRFAVAAGDRLCCCHTDGGWIDAGDGWTYPEPWRQKERASRLRVLDPQVLAYTDAGGVERYVVSGWPQDAAGERFETDWRERYENRRDRKREALAT